MVLGWGSGLGVRCSLNRRRFVRFFGCWDSRASEVGLRPRSSWALQLFLGACLELSRVETGKKWKHVARPEQGPLEDDKTLKAPKPLKP